MPIYQLHNIQGIYTARSQRNVCRISKVPLYTLLLFNRMQEDMRCFFKISMLRMEHNELLKTQILDCIFYSVTKT